MLWKRTYIRPTAAKTDRSVSLDPDVFDVTPSDHAIWLDVRAIQAAARQGTHKAKERGETAGSTRKLYRQKGTGNSRAGSAKSPIRKSGGTTFRAASAQLHLAHQPEDQATGPALGAHLQGARRRVAHRRGAGARRAEYPQPSLSFCGALELEHHKVLLLTSDLDETLYRSGRNIPKLSVRNASAVSTLDVLEAQAVILQDGALGVLSSLLGKGGADQKETTDETAEAPKTSPPSLERKRSRRHRLKAKRLLVPSPEASAEADVADETKADEAGTEEATTDVPKAEQKASAETETSEAQTPDEGAGEEDEETKA